MSLSVKTSKATYYVLISLLGALNLFVIIMLLLDIFGIVTIRFALSFVSFSPLSLAEQITDSLLSVIIVIITAGFSSLLIIGDDNE